MPAEFMALIAAEAAIVALSLALALHVWTLRRVPGARAFAGLMACCAWWTLTAIAEQLTAGTRPKMIWSQWSYLGIAPLPVLWYGFTRAYVQEDRPPEGPLLRWLKYWPPLLLTLVFTNGWHRLLWADWQRASAGPWGTLVYTHGPVFYLNVAVTWLLLLAGLFDLLHSGRSSVAQRRQMAVVALGVLAPLGANAVYVAGVAPPGVDTTPLAFSVSVVVTALALFRYQLFDLLPVARSAVLTSLTDGVLVADAAGRLVLANPAALALLQLDEAVVGEPVAVALAPFSLLRAAFAEGQPATEFRLGGEPARWLAARLTEFRPPHGPPGRLALLRDVTTERQAAVQRLELERRRAQERHLRSLVELSSAVAHDFNNIMTAVLGNADLALEMLPADSPARACLTDIHNAVLQAAALTNQLMQYSGQSQREVRTVAVDELLLANQPALAALLPPTARLRLSVDTELPTIQADPAQLEHVLSALVANAGEALGEAGGEVLVQLGSVRTDEPLPELRVDGGDLPPGRYLTIEVIDDGQGMTDEVRERARQPFFTTRFIGRGLGLAAVEGIVRRQHGGLTIESAPGRGTRVAVVLPAE